MVMVPPYKAETRRQSKRRCMQEAEEKIKRIVEQLV